MSADILIKVFIEMILEKSSTKHIWENLYTKKVQLSGILLMVCSNIYSLRLWCSCVSLAWQLKISSFMIGNVKIAFI